ncbi:hypothetical protein SC127_15470 [Pantoea sp. T14]|uniref:hypothetical protein n=1 Tax=Pantoea sp. T14 TaxID=3085685 RepID=UPI002FCC8F7F
MKNSLIAGLIGALSLVSFNASAEWMTKVEDDLFSGGKQAMMYGTISQINGIIFDCTKDELSLSYVEKGPFNAKEPIPLAIIVKVDGNDPLKLEGNFKKRNDEYMQAISNQADIVQVLSQLKQAKSKFLIGLNVQAVNKKMSFTADVVGSTKAVNDFAEACEIKL